MGETKTRKLPSVLIVDDNRDVLESLGAVLGDSGFAPALAENGRAALEAAAMAHPAVAVVDMILPDTNGAELARRLRGRCPGIPIVGLSAWYSDPDTASLARPYFDKVLAKPFDMDEFVKEVIRLAVTRSGVPGTSLGRKGALPAS